MKSLNIISTSIRNRIIVGIILLLVIPVVIVYFFSYSAIEKVIIEKVNEHISSNLSQVDQKIEGMLDNLISASNIIAEDEKIINLLKEDYIENADDFRRLQNVKMIEGAIANVRNSLLKFSMNSNVVILKDDGSVFSLKNDENTEVYESLKKLRQEGWYQEVRTSKGFFQWIAPHKNYLNNSGEPYVSLGRAIVDPLSYKTVGVLLVSISTKELKRELGVESGSDDRGIFILNGEENIVFTNISGEDRNKILTAAKEHIPSVESHEIETIKAPDGQKMLVSYRDVQRPEWKTIYVVSLKSITEDVQKVRISFLFTTEGVVLAFTVFLILFVNRIIRPVNRLKKAMKEISSGNFEVKVDVESKDELGLLSKNFNLMTVKIKSLIDEVEEKQKTEQRLKFEALQAQINPHFLFNTLNTIKLAAETSQAYNIGNMIKELGQLLEYSMDFSEDEITLERELGCIESFIFLQNLRFNQMIRLTMDIDEGLMKAPILKFILQPIVENSIIHGFSNAGSGEINVSAKKTGDEMTISVRDNGKGIPDGSRHSIFAGDGSIEKRGKKYSKIGLHNVRKRIQLKYGEDYGLTILSGEGAGTEVVIKIPLRA